MSSSTSVSATAPSTCSLHLTTSSTPMRTVAPSQKQTGGLVGRTTLTVFPLSLQLRLRWSFAAASTGVPDTTVESSKDHSAHQQASEPQFEQSQLRQDFLRCREREFSQQNKKGWLDVSGQSKRRKWRRQASNQSSERKENLVASSRVSCSRTRRPGTHGQHCGLTMAKISWLVFRRLMEDSRLRSKSWRGSEE